MTKIDVFDKIDDLSHRNSSEQLFDCRDSVIMTDVTKNSTFEQKMLYMQWVDIYSVHILVDLHQKADKIVWDVCVQSVVYLSRLIHAD